MGRTPYAVSCALRHRWLRLKSPPLSTLECPVSQLPPQDLNDYPYIKGTCASTERANSTESSTALPPTLDSAGYPWAGSEPVYPAGPYPFGGFQPPSGAPGGYPWNGPMPVPNGPYPPMGLTPVLGFAWNDPVRTCECKRSENRKVSLSSGIIGVVTMIIQMIIIAVMFLSTEYLGQQDLLLLLVSFLIVVFAPIFVGLGWMMTFILALVACIQARSRMPQVQPDGWGQAKTPTMGLLVVSIVAGLPTVIMYVILYEGLSRGNTDDFIDGFLGPLLIFCGPAQILIAVGFAFLLRMSAALDPAVRAPQAPGTQSA